jgi:2-methylcitrate dehydratase
MASFSILDVAPQFIHSTTKNLEDSTMDYVLKFLTDYAESLTYEKLPNEVVHEVKRRVIDSLGCALGGYNMLPPKIARAHALEVTANPGATVLGTSHRTSAELAAFANGVMVRYLDFNDTSHSRAGGHPSDNIPAVMAAAEYSGADSHALITGIVLAYEVMDRFGDYSPITINRGWDYVTYQAFSTAAGAAKVFGLGPEQMANALALAVVPNAAFWQTRVGRLSNWKGCAAGNAGRNGVFAALLAKRGLTGPDEAFAGTNGFLNQVAGGSSIELKGFGGEGRIFKLQEAKLKYYPSDYETQCAVHPALELRRELGGKVDDIEKIIVDTYRLAIAVAADTPDKWNPKTRETADHSLPYILSVAFTKGNVWLDDFTPERINDPLLRSLMPKIEVREKEEYTRAFPDSHYFRIEVITRSGQHLVRETRYAKGHSKNPMSDAEIEDKFRRLAAPLLKPAQISNILERLWHLEEVSVPEIMSLFKL